MSVITKIILLNVKANDFSLAFRLFIVIFSLYYSAGTRLSVDSVWSSIRLPLAVS